MTYKQSREIFDAMDNLELYAKLYTNELHKDDCEYENLTHYKESLDRARCTIFNLVEKAND